MSALPDAVAAALEAVGRRLRVDRVTLWDPPGEARLACIHQWTRPGCPPPVEALAADELPWLVAELSAGRRVVFRSCAALPREASRERQFLSRHGPRSGAMLPLVVGGAPVAVLSVGTLRRERAFGGSTLVFLERVGVVLAGALGRKRAHDAALEAEGRLAGILEAVPDGALLFRSSGRVERANGRATAILLRARHELCAERVQDLLAPAPDCGWRRVRSTLDALLTTDEPLELCARRADGSTVPVEVRVRRLPTPGDALFCCVVRDVSEHRRAREESDRLRSELAFMGRTSMLAEMGAGIAHELNQPLTAILSNAESAERLLRAPGHDTDEIREALRDVVADTRRAAGVLGRMRDMLRRRDVEHVPVDLEGILGSVARRFREEAVARAIHVSLELAPGLPPVQGDPVQLEQVAMNLVLNAFEAMGAEGTPPRTIAIRARPTEPDGVDVSVRDSGPGLEDEALAHAFDAFFTTKPRGLGMGLSISRSIVEAHGGRLLARNNADRGATFEFHLPAASQRTAEAGRRRRA